MAESGVGIIENESKAAGLNEKQLLKERIDEEGANYMVHKLVSLLKLSKALERQGSELQYQCNVEYSGLLAEISELEKKSLSGTGDNYLCDDLDRFICDSLEKLNSSKRELAVKLQEVVSLKRQLGELPIQAELIQYERRFSELYVHIQERLQQTRKYYATYNALVEIKDLMLKETSLLNSISAQFQDAVSSSAGCTKLIDSLESILKGTQQKLEKVQLTLQGEQKACDALREKYATAITEQRRASLLLKAFQDECANNERLRGQASSMQHSQPQSAYAELMLQNIILFAARLGNVELHDILAEYGSQE
ncbi:hypothetical protein Nepgr_000870 [Nepenthes gracilis]|uniref:CCDC93 coiled-coil domain-containing protein n=1 Tax=Nepenthes gracilis TaxID=150966 RepID=A0AAD3RWV7_NEPGR|nr:hypothetical protein Nepgr_000870 [Nepenthes gracilis]